MGICIKSNKFRRFREESAPRASNASGMRCSNFEHLAEAANAGEADLSLARSNGVERPGRDAIDPSLAPPTCSVIVSCGSETIDLREETSPTP